MNYSQDRIQVMSQQLTKEAKLFAALRDWLYRTIYPSVKEFLAQDSAQEPIAEAQIPDPARLAIAQQEAFLDRLRGTLTEHSLWIYLKGRILLQTAHPVIIAFAAVVLCFKAYLLLLIMPFVLAKLLLLAPWLGIFLIVLGTVLTVRQRLVWVHGNFRQAFLSMVGLFFFVPFGVMLLMVR